EQLSFVGGKTKGICKISSADPRLSSVPLYLEYELGNAYTVVCSPSEFKGNPLVLISPFSNHFEYKTSSYKIITGLDHSKTKFIDNDNYVIEFVKITDLTEQKHEQSHIIGLTELVKSNLNITDNPIETMADTVSTKTVMTQTEPIVEDTKKLTYIAKGIMFKAYIVSFGMKRRSLIREARRALYDLSAPIQV
ncbi:4953_t:CDS:1, partial [Scutellospora calospora]